MNGILTTSWDDGSPCNMRLAERLAAHRLPATFYVSRQGERQVVGPGEIRVLEDMGFEVGAHTLTHVEMPRCSPREAREEIVGAKEWVEHTTGVSCRMFCFPRGRFGWRDLRLVAEAGFLGARTVEFLSTDWPERRAGVLVMPTTVLAVNVSTIRLARNLIRRGRWLRLGRRAREVVAPGGWHRSAMRLAEEVRERGGVFHLWGHSWEIDRDGSWGILDDLLARLADMFAPGERVTNGQICALAALRGRGSPRE